ncbi:MAG: hypothetical protein JJU15_18410 [Pararhodobacter sp.]|nr:hypothetical protein [Pararhodobacter sp.]
MKSTDTPEKTGTPRKTGKRRGTPRPAGFVVSFVDRNWLWSRFGLALSLALAVLIAGLMLMPLPQASPMPAGLDKIYHFIAFMALVFPVVVTDTDRWTWVVPSAIGFGGVLELIQPMVGRTGDWLDFGASVSGVMAGAALAEILHDRMRRSVVGSEDSRSIDLPLLSEDDRLEAMRSELMAELRAVLREELEAVTRQDRLTANPAAKSVDAGAGTDQTAPESAPGAPPTAPETARPPTAPAVVTPTHLKGIAARDRGRIALKVKRQVFDEGFDAEDGDLPEPRVPMHPTPEPRPSGDSATRH